LALFVRLPSARADRVVTQASENLYKRRRSRITRHAFERMSSASA
jgi:hypothetical protein